KEMQKINKQFVKNSPELGYTNRFEHKIKLKEDVIINKKPYKIPHSIMKPCQEELIKLENLGIIRKSISTFSSPAFPIKKKNGKLRIVVDYRKLNEITVPQYYPLPSIMDLIMHIGDSKIFTQLDLNSGYYQIPMAEESIQYTGFSICNQHYEFLRMPFGLVNAPRTFQQTMLSILGHLNFVKVFLDDVLIHSADIETHLIHLKDVIELLKINGLTLNVEKSNICANQSSGVLRTRGLRRRNKAGYKSYKENFKFYSQKH
ncbi:Retrovirus-related Pol polyprotein from transposon, partial [Dictyocoela roeselum]